MGASSKAQVRGVSATSLWYPVAGVRLGVAAAGIRYSGRADLLVIELAEGGSCAAGCHEQYEYNRTIPVVYTPAPEAND